MYVDYLLSSLRPLMSLMRGPFTGALSYREKNQTPVSLSLNHFSARSTPTTLQAPHKPPPPPRPSTPKGLDEEEKGLMVRYSFQTCDRHDDRGVECDERFMTCFHDTEPTTKFDYRPCHRRRTHTNGRRRLFFGAWSRSLSLSFPIGCLFHLSTKEWIPPKLNDFNYWATGSRAGSRGTSRQTSQNFSTSKSH